MSHLTTLAPLPPTWQWTTKWLYFVAWALALGSALTTLLVIRPALPRLRRAAAGPGLTAVHRVTGLSAWLLVIASLLSAVAAVAKAHKTDFSTALSPTLVQHYLTAAPDHGAWWSNGQVALAKLVLVTVAAVVLLPAAGRGASAARVLPIGTGILLLALLLGVLPTGPAANTLDGWLDRASAQGHILGSSLWAGGLLALLVLTRVRADLHADTVGAWLRIWHRFGTLAMVSVGLLTLSGAYLSFMHVGSFAQLVTTTYGIVLTTKLVLVALLLAAGAFNQLVLMPRLVRAHRDGDTEAGRRTAIHHFGGVVLSECLVITLVLVAASLLSGSARVQAHGQPAGPVTASLLGFGALILLLLVASLWATARMSAAIGGGSYRAELGARP